jgi:hypothetical protein
MSRWIFILCFQIGILGCQKVDADEINPDHLRFVNEKALKSVTPDDVKIIPPEKIAAVLVSHLENTNQKSKLAQVRQCAATQVLRELGSKSKCYNVGSGGDSEEDRCALKSELWKGKLARAFAATPIDVNNDKFEDYIVNYNNSCEGLASGNIAEYFLLMSQPDKSYKLVLRTEANIFSILPSMKNNALVVIEGVNSYSGQSYNIWTLQDSNYLNDACLYQSKTELNSKFKSIQCPSN